MDKQKIRTILNIIFIIGAVLTVVFYYTTHNQQLYLYTCGLALACKMAEVLMRMIRYK